MAIVLVLSMLYALPNLYPKDPAVQISANRGGKVDQALVTRVDALATSKQLATKSVAIEGDNLVVRLANIDHQTQAADLIRPELGPAYNVADGFEGSHDAQGHRTVSGWKVAGLPWRQG